MWSQRMSPRGHAEHLVVAAGLVGHLEHADRACVHDAAREHRLGQQDHRVQRIAVLAERVLDEAVVGGIAHRGVQVAVQLHPAAVVVHLVLVARTLRDLDDDVELHRRGSFPCAPVLRDGLTLTERYAAVRGRSTEQESYAADAVAAIHACGDRRGGAVAGSRRRRGGRGAQHGRRHQRRGAHQACAARGDRGTRHRARRRRPQQSRRPTGWPRRWRRSWPTRTSAR